MKHSLLLISCSCFISTKLVSSSSTTTNNHHETVKSTLEAQQYAQYGPTVFAPGGRLHGVESVAKEAMLLDGGSSSSDSVSCGVFAMHCSGSSNEDGEFVVMVGIGALSPYLHRDEAYYRKEQEDVDSTDTTATSEEGTTYIPLTIEDTSTSTTAVTNPISILSPTLIVGAGGKAIDSTILLRRAMEVSLSMFSNDNGGVDWFIHHSLEGINGNFDGCDPQRSRPIMGGAASVDVSSLARRVADMAQSSTQSMGGKYGRMLSSNLLAVGARNPSNNINNTDDDHLILWRVDPTGQFWRLHSSAVGRGGMKIEAELLQHVQRWKKPEQKQQNDEEEDDVHVSREDIRTYLGSLTVKEAIEVATDCFVKGIMSSNMKDKQSSSKEDILDRKLFEIGLRKRIQTVVLRSNTSGKASSCIEVV